MLIVILKRKFIDILCKILYETMVYLLLVLKRSEDFVNKTKDGEVRSRLEYVKSKKQTNNTIVK